MRAFESFHPVTSFIYFVSVVLISMFTFHPIIILISLIGAFVLSISIDDKAKHGKTIILSGIAIVLIAFTNPLFSHRGVTDLFYLNNNPVTFESFIYGISIGVVLVGIFYWFKSYTYIFTSEKLLYLFSKISPKISLLLSTVLRFIPMFKVQIKKISDAQKTLGKYSSNKLIDKIKASIAIFSIMVTWSFEMAIQTADSMKARGFGIKKRNSYSNFKFASQDVYFLILNFLLFAISVLGINTKELEFFYYPRLSEIDFGRIAFISYLAFGFLVSMPTIIQIKEKLKWKYLISRI